jgi:hypothetical protein
LLDWSTRYHHLREVTHDDVVAGISGLRGEARRSTVTALRSLFGWARRGGVIFRNPANGICEGRSISRSKNLDVSTSTTGSTPCGRISKPGGRPLRNWDQPNTRRWISRR